MKKTTIFIVLILLGAANLRADDQTASVQQELKDQGFYYGQVDGQAGAETTAAIRRYQIRNGLQVTGTLTQETLGSLKGAAVARVAGTSSAPANNPPPQPAPLDTQPQAQQPPQQDVAQSDREFLRKQGGAAAVTPAPAPAPAPSSDDAYVAPAPPPPVAAPQQPPSLGLQYASLFERTPYENAPPEVQQGTLRSAQMRLARQTYYNGEIDGIPGPATAHAIVAFQSNEGLARTGRLDIETLGALRLLPNSGPVVRRVIIQPFFPPPRYERPVYRGIWVN